MKKFVSTILTAALASLSVSSLAAVVTLDVGGYLQQQGWKRYDTTALPRSPVPDVVPLMFYDKGNSVPSCGLLTATAAGKGPTFIELVGSEPGAGFPQCLSISAITPFQLQNREYIVVEYLSRETREDVERRFHYLVRSATQGFFTDKELTDAAPVSSAGQGEAKPAAATAPDGVRIARIAQLKKAEPAWRLIERDVVSDKSSSFATLEDKKAAACQFVTEAGAAPVIASNVTFARSSKCDSVQASSRFEKSGKIYYLAMFKTNDRKQLVGVTSVAADGRIEVETTLSEFINQRGMTRDMKTAKAALVKELQ